MARNKAKEHNAVKNIKKKIAQKQQQIKPQNRIAANPKIA